MKYIFWQNIVSLHQSAFLSALSEKHDVTLIAEKELEQYRVDDGWGIPEMGNVRIIMAPSIEDIKDILKDNADAVHIFSGIDAYPIVFQAFKMAIAQGLKVLNMLEPYEWAGVKGFLRRVKYTMLRLRYGKKIDGLLAMGQIGVDSYIKAGFKPEKIFQWGYFTKATEASPLAPLPRGEGYNGKPRVLFVGRLDENKNSRLLIKTMEPMMKDVDCLTIVGDGYLHDEIEAMVAQIPNANCLGNVPNTKVHELMQQHDILVLPSNYDGWGAVINEALQNGMRVIVSQNCGGNVLADGVMRGEKFCFREGDKSLENVLKKWIVKGALSSAEREEIKLWSDKHISGENAADYFEGITFHIYCGAERPVAPWVSKTIKQLKKLRATPETINTKGMKILQTITGLSAKLGGPSTCTCDLLEGLRDINANVDLLTFEAADNLGKGNAWLKEVGNDAFLPLGLSKNFRKALEDSKYDIYHCNTIWMYCNHITCKMARDKHKPYILSPHGMLYPTALAIKPWKKWPALKLWFNKDIHSATCIHATCQQEAEHVRAFGYKGPIAVIPNPVVIPDFLKRNSGQYFNNSTSQHFNSSDEQQRKVLINGRKQIGFLGRLHPIKKIENVLYALGLLYEEEREKLSFQIMGKYDNRYELWLKDEVKRLHLEDCVEFVGFVSGEDKYKRLQNLWALMVPSAQENFGMIVPEALICGTPVYASLGTPWSELNKYDAGWWKDNSPETIAEILREIISMDENTCIEMGRNGRKLIEEKYEQHKVAQMMYDLYRWIAGEIEKPEFVYTDKIK